MAKHHSHQVLPFIRQPVSSACSTAEAFASEPIRTYHGSSTSASRCRGVSGLCAWLTLSLRNERLCVDGPLAGGRGRVDLRRAAELGLEFVDLGILLGNAFCRSQESELDNVAVDGRQFLRLGIGQRSIKRRQQYPNAFICLDSRVHSLQIPRARGWRKSELSEFLTFLSAYVLQIGEVLPRA